MIRKFALSAILLSIVVSITAQEITNDILNVKYEKKSARKAMLLSALVPGAGQYYADKSSFTTYLFPVIEIGLWVGYFHYYNEGLDKEASYEDYADQYYERNKQYLAQEDLHLTSNNDMYDTHFHLDVDNTQHFYEDIGKYNKYIFGWDDWFAIYASEDGTTVSDTTYWSEPNWILDDEDTWIGNNPTNPGYDSYAQNQELYDAKNGRYSVHRAIYDKMRADAEKLYDKAGLVSFGIAFNHIFAALDAVRVTKRANLTYISGKNFNIGVKPVFVNNNLSPAITVSTRF